jgi:hypothetical protein
MATVTNWIDHLSAKEVVGARLARKRHGANDHKSNITDW